jgi:hypothetical protein
MQQSCLLCISTLLESGNHYSRMFELKDGHTGEPLFETIQISLYAGYVTHVTQHRADTPPACPQGLR